MKTIKKSRKYSVIYNDINNTCNARCKYCINSWEKKENSVFMDEQTLEKIMCGLPWLEGPFLFGCLYEPSVHPNYLELLKKLIPQYKNNAFYTSNLVKKLSDEEIYVIANADLSYINFSIDTLSEKTANELMKIKESHIISNLENIANIFKKVSNAPKIHIVTMVLKDNLSELTEIGKYIKEKIKPEIHEFRVPYYDLNIEEKREYIESQLIGREELTLLGEKLKAIGEHVSLFLETSRETYEQYYENEKENGWQNAVLVQLPKEEYYTVRINSKGDCHFYGDDVVININDMESPFRTFGQRLIELQDNHAKTMKLENFSDYIKELKYDAKIFIEPVIEYDNRFISLSGWINVEQYFMNETKKYIMIDDGNEQHCYKANTVHRPDVAKALNLKSAEYSGFETFIKIQKEWFNQDIKIYTILEDSAGNFYKTEIKQAIEMF